MIALFGQETAAIGLHGSLREQASQMVTWEKWSVLQEMYDLARLRLLNNRSGSAYVDIVDIDPQDTQIDGVANVLFRLTEMVQLSSGLMRPDIAQLVAFLR
jgi:hypothetical protein